MPRPRRQPLSPEEVRQRLLDALVRSGGTMTRGPLRQAIRSDLDPAVFDGAAEGLIRERLIQVQRRQKTHRAIRGFSSAYWVDEYRLTRRGRAQARAQSIDSLPPLPG